MKLSVSAYALWAFSFVAAQRVQQPLQQETVSGKPVQVAIIGTTYKTPLQLTLS